MDQRLNISAKTVKLLEENIGEKFHDIGFGSDFFYETWSTGNTRKIHKFDDIKSKISVQKGHNKQSENAAHGMGNIICKSYIR